MLYRGKGKGNSATPIPGHFEISCKLSSFIAASATYHDKTDRKWATREHRSLLTYDYTSFGTQVVQRRALPVSYIPASILIQEQKDHDGWCMWNYVVMRSISLAKSNTYDVQIW